jgi:hypothetical protein
MTTTHTLGSYNKSTKSCFDMTQPKMRRLKVAPHYKRLHPCIAISSSLRLQGDWLTEAGFVPGKTALIQVEAGRLIITAN